MQTSNSDGSTFSKNFRKKDFPTESDRVDPCTAKRASDGASSLQHSQLHTHFSLVDEAGCSSNASFAVRFFPRLEG